MFPSDLIEVGACLLLCISYMHATRNEEPGYLVLHESVCFRTDMVMFVLGACSCAHHRSAVIICSCSV
jgi:hypothetical protein